MVKSRRFRISLSLFLAMAAAAGGATSADAQSRQNKNPQDQSQAQSKSQFTIKNSTVFTTINNRQIAFNGSGIYILSGQTWEQVLDESLQGFPTPDRKSVGSLQFTRGNLSNEVRTQIRKELITWLRSDKKNVDSVLNNKNKPDTEITASQSAAAPAARTRQGATNIATPKGHGENTKQTAPVRATPPNTPYYKHRIDINSVSYYNSPDFEAYFAEGTLEKREIQISLEKIAAASFEDNRGIKYQQDYGYSWYIRIRDTSDNQKIIYLDIPVKIETGKSGNLILSSALFSREQAQYFTVPNNLDKDTEWNNFISFINRTVLPGFTQKLNQFLQTDAGKGHSARLTAPVEKPSSGLFSKAAQLVTHNPWLSLGIGAGLAAMWAARRRRSRRMPAPAADLPAPLAAAPPPAKTQNPPEIADAAPGPSLVVGRAPPPSGPAATPAAPPVRAPTPQPAAVKSPGYVISHAGPTGLAEGDNSNPDWMAALVAVLQPPPAQDHPTALTATQMERLLNRISKISFARTIGFTDADTAKKNLGAVESAIKAQKDPAKLLATKRHVKNLFEGWADYQNFMSSDNDEDHDKKAAACWHSMSGHAQALGLKITRRKTDDSQEVYSLYDLNGARLFGRFGIPSLTIAENLPKDNFFDLLKKELPPAPSHYRFDIHDTTGAITLNETDPPNEEQQKEIKRIWGIWVASRLYVMDGERNRAYADDIDPPLIPLLKEIIHKHGRLTSGQPITEEMLAGDKPPNGLRIGKVNDINAIHDLIKDDLEPHAHNAVEKAIQDQATDTEALTITLESRTTDTVEGVLTLSATYRTSLGDNINIDFSIPKQPSGNPGVVGSVKKMEDNGQESTVFMVSVYGSFEGDVPSINNLAIDHEKTEAAIRAAFKDYDQDTIDTNVTILLHTLERAREEVLDPSTTQDNLAFGRRWPPRSHIQARRVPPPQCPFTPLMMPLIKPHA